LERQDNGWWRVRFTGIPEALTEGKTKEEARANARDCVITALEGYMKAGKPLPRAGAGHTGSDRAVLPLLVTAKLAVYEAMRARGWSKVKLAKELGMPENSVRRLLDLHNSSHMWIIDDALAKMNTEPSIDLPKVRPTGKAAWHVALMWVGRRRGSGAPTSMRHITVRSLSAPKPLSGTDPW
jgi:antitoxin HicB